MRNLYRPVMFMGDSAIMTMIDTCVETEWFVETIATVLGSTETWDVTIDH